MGGTTMRAAVIRGTVDFCLTAVVGLGVLLFFVAGKPYHRGFYCDDDSIRYPYKDSTVSNGVLYIVGIALPILVVLGGEFARFRVERQVERARGGGGAGPGADGGSRRRFLACLYRYVGIFLFGAACSQFITDVAKYSIGRLRPHFWGICQPNINCDTPLNKNRYIEDYECNGTDDFRIKESRLSFVSGHASFSTYTMLFAAAYLQFRWPFRRRTPKTVRHFIQFVLVLMAWYTSLSRVSDYKHHPTDVLAGALVGAVVAALTTFVVSNKFRPPRDELVVGGGAGRGGGEEEGTAGRGDGKVVEMASTLRG